MNHVGQEPNVYMSIASIIIYEILLQMYIAIARWMS